MKIQVLNDKLVAGKCSSVLFPYPPVAIPLNEAGMIVPEASASKAGYTTIVYRLDDDSFYLFEFTDEIVDGLLAYRSRRGTISNLEVLLSRDTDGSIRMTTGNAKIKPNLISKEKYEEFLNYHNGLFDKYMSKLGRKMQESAQ